MNIRLLVQEDWQSWKQLRLESLHTVPEAFGSSFEEESRWSDEKFRLTLENNTIVGAFINDQLIGYACFSRLASPKMSHRAVLWGVYVKQEHRSRGIANKLVETIIAHAKSHVIQLHLTVVTTNQTAVKLYQKHGFRIYGTEPRALKIGSQFYDEYLMVREFE